MSRCSLQVPSEAVFEFFGLLGMAFPDREDAPNEAAERCGVVFVAGGIAFKLLLPPGALGFWDAGGFAVPV
jgi:hypothetical protein